MASPIHIDLETRELPTGPPQRSRVITELARSEGRRNVRSPWLWGGVVASAWTARLMLTADYQSGAYQGLLASSAGIAAATFVLGVLAGSRDRATTSVSAQPLAEETVVDADQRALARLLGLLPVVAVGVACVLATVGATRIEGGFWIGDPPGRTDSAQYGPFEVLQPIALFLAAGAAGSAIGRTRAPRTLACIIGAAFLGLSGFFWWAWGDSLAPLAPVQTQPFEVEITEVGERIDFSSVPADWLLAAPTRWKMQWSHLVIDQRIAAGHDVYLLGLAVLSGGLAVRGRVGRIAAVLGSAVAVGGVAVQVALLSGY